MTLHEIAVITACSIVLVSASVGAQATQPTPAPAPAPAPGPVPTQTFPAMPPGGAGGYTTTPPRRVIPMPFERSKWLVTLTPDKDAEAAGADAVEDALTFADGRMASHVDTAQGFAPSACESDSTSARCVSEAGDGRGKHEWRIECLRDALSGSLVATRPDGRIVRYRLEGRRAPVLEGTTWAIKLEPDAASAEKGEPARTESIAFARGKLVIGASARASVPADALSYVLTTAGNRHSVRATAEREDGVGVEWVAEFDGDVVKGTLRLSGPGATTRTLAFQGLKAPEAPPVDSRATSRPTSDSATAVVPRWPR